jgi:hypothetical protein
MSQIDLTGSSDCSFIDINAVDERYINRKRRRSKNRKVALTLKKLGKQKKLKKDDNINWEVTKSHITIIAQPSETKKDNQIIFEVTKSHIHLPAQPSKIKIENHTWGNSETSTSNKDSTGWWGAASSSSSSSRDTGRVYERTCNYCKATGHLIHKCPIRKERENKKSREEKPKSCFNCGDMQHIARNCPNHIKEIDWRRHISKSVNFICGDKTMSYRIYCNK